MFKEWNEEATYASARFENGRIRFFQKSAQRLGLQDASAADLSFDRKRRLIKITLRTKGHVPLRKNPASVSLAIHGFFKAFAIEIEKTTQFCCWRMHTKNAIVIDISKSAPCGRRKGE